MANGKTSTARRREVRRNLTKTEPGWRGLLRRHDVGWALLYATVFAVVATAIATPLIDRARPLQLGQTVEAPVVSRVPFTVVNEEATRDDQRYAANGVPPYFEPDTRLLQRMRESLGNLPQTLAGYASFEEVPEQKRTDLKLDPNAFDALRKYASNEDGLDERWDKLIFNLTRDLFDTAIVSKQDLQARSASSVVVIHPSPQPGQPAMRTKAIRAVMTADDPALEAELAQIAAPLPPSTRPAVLAATRQLLAPTYRYSPTMTESARESAREAVPQRVEPRAAGEVLAQPGDQVTQNLLATLAAEQTAYDRSRTPVQRWLPRVGMLGLMAIIAGGLWVYFFAYCPRLTRNPMRGMVITALMLLCLGASVYSSLLWPDVVIGSLTFPTLFAATVLAIAYDQRFALAVGMVLSILVVIMLKLPLAATVIVVVGVASAVMQLREIRTRSKLVVVGTYAGLAMGATAAVVGLATKPVITMGVAQTVVIDALAAVTSGFFTGLLVQGALPLIERLFNVTTAMTLKELNDASHPLLQRLAHEAPGTYQHSLRIADMAESAAEAIDADALLCRVGSMYHDIGKTNKPAYFIENQAGGPNKHAKLSPAMSLLIIVGHVKDGVEMAREFGLPVVIRHFIESHHGTTLVEYFYHEAKKQTAAEDKPAPSEFEFRYPGPKPQSREAAIMMLCDCVEGAARAMDDPTPSRLENLVSTMANKRLMDGQFNDCDLTLSDLSRIEQAITKSLCAMYHQRIKYPEDKKLSDTATSKTAAG